MLLSRFAGVALRDGWLKPPALNATGSLSNLLRLLRLTGICAVASFFAVVPSLAQTLPPITADDQMGFQPFNSFHGGEIDHIGLVNGTVALDYPFLSYSQRGKLHLDFHLSYNNQPQHVAEQCTPVPPNGQKCVNLWNWVPFPSPLPLEKGDVFVGWAGQTAFYSTDSVVTVGSGNTAHNYHHSNWSIQTSDGSKHPLGDLGSFTYTGAFPDFYAVAGGPFATLDATAWRANGSLTTDDYGTNPPSVSQLVSPDGMVGGTQDPNGNVIATSLNSQGMATAFTDTLGRQITAPPTASSASNTSTSACPSGTLPVDHAVLWSVPGPNGGSSSFTFCYVVVAVNNPPGPATYFYTKSFTKLQSIVLPDGHNWSFQYNDPGDGSTFDGAPVNYGTLTQITLPTGGTISYTYTTNYGTGGITCQNAGRFVASRTINANDGSGNHTWTYSYVTTSTGNNSSPWSVATTVTDPLGNQTVHTFNSLYAQDNCPAYEAQTQYYQGSQSGGALLKTINTTYSYTPGDNKQGPLNVVPTKITTTWAANGLTMAVSKSYDSGFTYTNYAGASGIQGIYGKELSESASDYAKSNPPTIKTANTSYLAFSNSSYLTANLLDLVSSRQITDGSGNQLAKTTYGYDESSLQSSGVTTQLGAPPNSVRGNLTSVNRWLNTAGGNVTTTSRWYDSGELYQPIDALGNTTTHSYDLAYAGAFSTKTTNALSQTLSGTYDFNTGVLTSFTDANGSYQATGNTPGDPAHTTTLQYNDPMWRLTQVQSPADPSGNHPLTTINYPDANTVERLKTITSNLTDDAYGYFDGVGRHYKAVHATAGNATTVTSYDADGHTSNVTNPYFSTNDPTYGTTTTQYDGVGRVTKTIKQDNSAVTAQYNQTSTNSPNGDCTVTTDEAGKSRKTCLDGLSRLIEVDEPQASSGSMTNPYVTLYSYDALGNLLSVNQKGDGSQAARQRTFTYDSLSRLLTATNPESGQISYSYDANGNVLQKVSPAPNQTGAATQTISYCYDKLNRVTGKAYSAQSCPLNSPVVTYSYDSGTNGIGHLTSLTDQAGSGSYSYDALGRITTENRTIAGIQKSLSYTYNLDNSVATLTYPSGAMVTYTPDAAGRVLSAVDVANNINYVTGATYGADNSLTGFLGGQSNSFAGITNSFSYNPRLQPITMAAVAPDCTGTGCSASVGISGGLNVSPTGGGSAPAAANNSALTSFVDSSGNPHAFYFTTSQHLWHLSWNSGGWENEDVTALTGAPVAVSGSPLTSLFDSNGVSRVYYLDANRHIHETSCCGGGWNDSDMTAYLGATPAAAGSKLTSYSFSGANMNPIHVHYVGSNQHLFHMFLDTSGNWNNQDLTAVTGVQAASGSALTNVNNNSNGSAGVFFLDGNGHINETYCGTGQCWVNTDLTGLTGAAPAPGSGLTSYSFTSGNPVHVHYVGTNQHVFHLFQNTSGAWGNQDLTATTGASAAGSSAMTSVPNNGNGSVRLYFLDGNQHLNEAYCGPGQCWTNTDMTAAVGAAPASGSALTSYGLAADNSVHVHYEGGNQHIWHMFLNSSGWSNQDLFPTATVTLADSGTVSLSVGSFTATACFGPSTNPVCNNQAVNRHSRDVASALATALNASGSPVTATASGATINMTWKASGAATPLSPMSTTHDNPNLFPGPSFTSPAASFGGGTGGTLAIFSITYNFNLGNGDNGNVIGITNNRDTTRSQSFTYDYLNRLISAQNAGTDCTKTALNPNQTEYWGDTYSYDSWGNLLQKTVTKCKAEGLVLNADPQNRVHALSGPDFQYDTAGNLVYDATTTVHYSYDPENRINGAAGYTYLYDADGNRVEKSNGSTGTIYWYMSPGIVAESDLGGNLKSEYVLFDGERVARKDFAGNTSSVSYYFSDHLKTVSVITNAAGVITEDEDYYPWGGELQFVNSDSNHYKFTAKERDSESGLDYFGARYYGNWYGRFLSADWSAKPEAVPYSDLHDPQSLNLYSYVRNTPITSLDADGHLPGDFYNDKAQKIGTDGAADGKQYFVANKDEAKAMQQATTAGGYVPYAFSAVDLPNKDVRSAIGDSVKASDKPSGSDTQGGFHEEGGIFGTTTANQQIAIPAVPGAAANPAVDSQAHVDVGNAKNPALAQDLKSVDGKWHVHPSGSVQVGSQKKDFVQHPSPGDIKNASYGTNIVVGAGDHTVYFYGTNGASGSMSLQNFQKIP